jgi:hypothetical protein
MGVGLRPVIGTVTSARGGGRSMIYHTRAAMGHSSTPDPHMGVAGATGRLGFLRKTTGANRCLALLCATVLISRIVVMMGVESIVALRLYLHGFMRWSSLRACLVA